MDRFIIEKERNVKVIDDSDIIVAGGGTSGVIAAIAAARSGVKVLLVEQFGALGGSETQGLVTPLMNTHIDGNPMCSSISDEINNRMIEMGWSAGDEGNNKGHFDPVMMSFVLEDMVIESGVKLLYYTYICDVIKDGNRLKGLVVENKGGRGALLAKVIIDCTGDADVAARAGVPYEKGSPVTGKNQPMSVRYTMSGIDIKKFSEFLVSIGASCSYVPPIFHAATVWGGGWPLEKVFKQALDAGDITYEDGAYWQVFGIPGKRDALAFNCPEIFDRVDGTDAWDLTAAQVCAKKAILRQMKFYKKYLPGFEGCYVTEVAPQVGIRESRRIYGAYRLSDEDVILCRKFDDYIARSNYPIDIHGYNLTNKHMDMSGKDSVPYYEIPYRCLVPDGVKGMLIAGRCISASFTAQSSLRIQPTVRALGEAAGIASAMAVLNNSDADSIKGQDVRAEMVRRGAIF